MGWFDQVFNSKYKEDKKELNKIIKALCKDMDNWIKEFEDDGTPPNEEQCKELEDTKIAEILQTYASQATAVINPEEWNELADEYKGKITEDLEDMRGDLYRRFLGSVDALEWQASTVLKQCVKRLAREEAELKARLPVKESDVSDEIGGMMEDLTVWISTRFPEGIEGLDNYDDTLPDGLPSWKQFKEQSSAKEVELKDLNEKAIPVAIEEIKAKTLERVKKEIDDAINKTMAAVKEDLSDDTFPFLDNPAGLRGTLIELTEEYGKARLSES